MIKNNAGCFVHYIWLVPKNYFQKILFFQDNMFVVVSDIDAVVTARDKVSEDAKLGNICPLCCPLCKMKACDNCQEPKLMEGEAPSEKISQEESLGQ